MNGFIPPDRGFSILDFLKHHIVFKKSVGNRFGTIHLSDASDPSIWTEKTFWKKAPEGKGSIESKIERAIIINILKNLKKAVKR